MPTYPAASFCDPWASLFFVPDGQGKVIETRTRNLFGRLAGQTIAVHVSKKSPLSTQWPRLLSRWPELEALTDRPEGRFVHPGLVIGLIDLGETRRDTECSAADRAQLDRQACFESEGKWLTPISNPRLLTQPVPATGRVYVGWSVTIPANLIP